MIFLHPRLGWCLILVDHGCGTIDVQAAGDLEKHEKENE
jgi:hypothetical protein